MSSTTNDRYIVSGMNTVVIAPIEGIDVKDYKRLKEATESKIESKVAAIIKELKASHEKWKDPDFGPSTDDEFGAKSFYGNALPDPAGSKYPKPETLKWERPQYADEHTKALDIKEESAVEEDEDDEFGYTANEDEEDNEIWCREGALFVGGSSSGDVIQGQLGDCWFLSAISVMGAHQNLLTRCFWNGDKYKEFGIWVLRFFKDCNLIYVIIDDRIPVKCKDGKVIFAANKDPNELWVPLIEKAYAKLHGCYKALIGGFTHYGLADMTGFCPRLIVMKQGYIGYSEAFSDEDIWKLLNRYKKWKCLMGCSIQSNPKEGNKIEAEAGGGLHMGHAYSLLDIGEIKSVDGKPIRLLKLRNPWGRGEWEGAFSDNSPEREANDEEIMKVFANTPTVTSPKSKDNQIIATAKDALVVPKGDEQTQPNTSAEEVVIDSRDGTFFIPFTEWRERFTSLFIAINFPDGVVPKDATDKNDVDYRKWTGKRTQGSWSGEVGGNRGMGTWISNPKIKFRMGDEKKDPTAKAVYRRVFVGLYIKDSRLTMGFDYFKDPLYSTPLAFDIVTDKYLDETNPKNREKIPNGYLTSPIESKLVKDDPNQASQAPYNFGTTQIEVYLEVGVTYYIVPSLYKRGQAGTYFLNVYADYDSITLEGGISVSSVSKPKLAGSEPLKMSTAQFYEKKELLREKLVSEAERLNITHSKLQKIFDEKQGNDETMSRSVFKRRMMDLGFNLADFPDDDLVVLDENNDGTISSKEFLAFMSEGVNFSEPANIGPPPATPVDDLLFKPSDISGELVIKVKGARNLREPVTWFNQPAKLISGDIHSIS
eukprot:gene9214-12425_t